MALVVRRQDHPDLDETARLAAEAFESSSAALTADRLAWLYGGAFGQPAVVLGLFEGDRKVGQVVLIGQTVQIGSGQAKAVALVDLFVLKAFRSREAIATLYGEAERLCRASGIDVILAVPNGKAAGVNRHFLKLETAATLTIRAGVIPLPSPGRVRLSAAAGSIERGRALALLVRYLPARGTGVAWTAADLWERLQDPAVRYGLHASDDLLLVSSPRVRRRLPFTLLCGFFPRPGATVAPTAVRAVTAAACLLHRRPVFVYVGRNPPVPLPGFAVPDRLRPSLMIVQARDLTAGAGAVAIDRFELLDFDFV